MSREEERTSRDQPQDAGPPRSEEEFVELLRDAGPRPSVPEQHLEQIREHVRAEWRSSLEPAPVEKNGRWRWLAAAAALLIAAGSAWWFWQGPKPAVVVATIEVAGGATVGESLEVGTTLVVGDELRTGGGEVAALRTTSGHSVRVDENSSIRIEASDRIELLQGAVYVDADPRMDLGDIEVHTVFGVVREIGTQFEVRLPQVAQSQQAIAVRVREGIVLWLPKTDSRDTKRAEAGQRLLVAPDGVARVEPLDAAGDSWNWVLRAAPPLPLEGRTISSILEAAARELALELEYAGEGARERARSETLSSPPLPPRAALDNALLAARLQAREADGLLVVELASGDSR